MTPSVKLTYFPIAGRGEPTRLVLYIGGVDFEDERINFEQFAAAKKAGTIPFLSLPTLTVDGEVFAESSALLRYPGKLAGLYPMCEKAAMKVDMVVDAVENILVALFQDDSEEGRQKVVDDSIPRYVGAIDKIYAASGGPFLLGETMTIADVKLAHWVSSMNNGKQFDHIPAGAIDNYSNVMAARFSVLANEKVKAWNASH